MWDNIYLDVPMDDTIPWNIIYSNLSDEKWNRVDNLEKLEACLLSRNKAHLN